MTFPVSIDDQPAGPSSESTDKRNSKEKEEETAVSVESELTVDLAAYLIRLASGESGHGCTGMATWARRMHRRAATLGNVVTSCGHPATPPYPRRLEKVKFGVPLTQVCKADIPGPLLVLILKLNKEAPYKKDIFRAPGHQGNMKKLIHFMQTGRLVNIDNFSVYTIASVLKKFLRKLPGGIFGPEMEDVLFRIIDYENPEDKWQEMHQLITSMPIFSQRLLVLLFGTFRIIATNAERAQTGMTSEALGVSVAPSFFHSCVSDGQQAKMEDVVRFKTATRIMKYLIDNFGVTNLYGRENYEYYARITGRILKVDNEWIFAFRYPPETTASREDVLEAQQRWLQHEADRWGLVFNLRAMSTQEESHSTPAILQLPRSMVDLGEPSTSGFTTSRAIPENTLRESHTRLSVSLEESDLSKVHERQTARMHTRSEWFLSSPIPARICVVPIEFEDSGIGGHSCIVMTHPYWSSNGGGGKQPVRRTSSKEKKMLRRGSSKKNGKENGNKAVSVEVLHHEKSGSPRRGSVPAPVLVAQAAMSPPSRTQSTKSVAAELEALEAELTHTTLSYKPRI
ncbi:hypothetical protein CHUAL_005792 [Chamberlinius hualienensis]